MALTDAMRKQVRRYGRQDRALGGYAAAMGLFAAGALGLVGTAWRTGRRPPTVGPWELALLGLATHKVSRIIAKDAVTSPIRAPFTRFDGSAGDAELQEDVRGTGPPKAVGELISCPFCLGPWIATTFLGGLTFAPTVTRAAATLFAAVSISDFLQLGYAAAQQRTPPSEERAQETD